MTVFSRVGQAMYQNAQADAGGRGRRRRRRRRRARPTPSGEDEVVEGEIVEEGGGS